jgi:uncharacterized membrane protein
MSDPNTAGFATRPAGQPRAIGLEELDTAFAGGRGLGDRLYPTVAYMLMLMGVLCFGTSTALGALIAHFQAKKPTPEWLLSHYRFQLRTFKIAAVAIGVAVLNFLFIDQGAISAIIGAPLSLVLLLGMVWIVLRSAVGLGRLWRGEAILNYRTWLV